MRNIKIEIEYDGTNYCGWQRQNSRRSPVAGRRSKTIQETIEKALQRILQKKIKLIASGRTDSGVHAAGQIANFKTVSKISLSSLKNGLNSLLPRDILIRDIKEAPLQFHSRFSAKSKLYRYTILNRDYPDPFLRNYAHFCPYPLDINLMRKEAGCLTGRRDFKAFCAGSGCRKNTRRTIKKLIVRKRSFNLSPLTFYPEYISLILIDIEADGFLYNMARTIAGTLIEIGRGKFVRGSMRRILASKDRKLAGPTLPGRGLCLLKVKY